MFLSAGTGGSGGSFICTFFRYRYKVSPLFSVLASPAAAAVGVLVGERREVRPVGVSYLHSSLTATVSGISETISAGTSVPTLRNILVGTCNGALGVSNCGLRVNVAASVRTAVGRRNRVIMDTGLFLSVMHQLPRRVIFVRASRHVIACVTYKGIGCRVINVSSIRCPSLPSFRRASEVALGTGVLHSVVERAICTMDRGATGPVCANSLCRVRSNMFGVVTVSNCEVTVHDRGMSDRDGGHFIIPKGARRRILGLLASSRRGARVVVNRQRVAFGVGGCEVVSHLVRNAFVRCGSTVPGRAGARMIVGAEAVVSTIREVSLLGGSEVRDPMEYVFSSSRVGLSYASTMNETGSMVSIPVVKRSIRVNFGGECLLSTLGGTSASRVGLVLGNSLATVVMGPIGNSDCLDVIIPVELTGRG